MVKNDLGKIYIKKRAFPEWLTLFILLIPLTFGFFIGLLRLPTLIKYVIDIIWLVLLGAMILKKSIIMHKRIVLLFAFVGVFLAYSFILYLFNFQSPFYFLWGVRNNFRFYVAFFAFVVFLSNEDVNSVFKIFDFLFWVNAAVSIIQYFVFGYDQDKLGGIFGTEIGVNAYTLIFFVVIISKSLISYMSKKESMLLCFSKCGVSVFIAALAELKVYFVIFIMLLVFSAVFTAFSWRKLIILILGAFAVIFGSLLLSTLFGFESTLSLANIWKLATQKIYSGAGTVNRLSAIPVLAKTLITDFHEHLFGLGLGNCDTSSFKICNTPFYQNYGHLRYSWFSCAILFLETGYIGLLIFMAFFVACYILANKRLKSGLANPLYCQMAMIMSVVCIILTFYNSSLRTEAAYMVYFVLALPFINLQNVAQKD